MKNANAFVTLLLFLTACAAPPKSAQKPNVLAIVNDDQGYADLSAYAHSAGDISTPNMDRIARDGVLFTQAYVSAPVCSPSRAGWNTGRYQERWDPKAGWNPGLPENVATLAEYFQRAGYVTGKVGKNDFGDGYHKQDVREYPLNHGYDEFLGFSSHAHDYFLLSSDIEQRTPDPHGNSAALGALFDNRGKRSFESGYTTEIFTDWAIDFLKRHGSEPFFLHVAYNSVHHLIHEVPRQYLDRFGAPPIPNYDPATMGNYRDYYNKYAQLGAISDQDIRKYYLANLACLDDNIGRLLDALDAAGLSQNTLLVLFGDNGGSPYTGADNRPLRGGKYGAFEGGVRVPFMMRWPGELPAGQVYPHAVSTLDILPTALEAAGIPLPPAALLDGESILEPVKTGAPPITKDRPFFWEFRDRWAVRQGRWKLVRNPDATPLKSSSQILTSGDSAADQPALFDLQSDPAEQHNVARENPEVLERLARLFEQWREEMHTARP